MAMVVPCETHPTFRVYCLSIPRIIFSLDIHNNTLILTDQPEDFYLTLLGSVACCFHDPNHRRISSNAFR